jgi:GT2 family glycosyltransferase
MIKISAVIITYNEEKNILRCIESVRPVADEIVVLDCFSTDRTKEICEANGVEFHQRSFPGFAKQKNNVVALASHNHVLSLDADEYLSAELTQSILKAKSNWKADGYVMNRLSSFAGTWIKTCGWYPDQKLRLWDRRKGSWQGDGVHERVELAAGCHTKNLSGDLFHRAYDNISQFLQKNQSYSSIHAQVNRYKTTSSPIKILYKTAFAFFKAYILKGGVLDGYEGLIVSGSTAHWVFYKYAKLLEANRSLRLSLVVESTQDLPALKHTLDCVRFQKVLPEEVIVNGPAADMAADVRDVSDYFPVPLRFVPGRLREALAETREEYVVLLKDTHIKPSFIKNQKSAAWKGQIVHGAAARDREPVNPIVQWSSIINNGTVAFWKEDWGTKPGPDAPSVPTTPTIKLQNRSISVVIPNYNGLSLFEETLPTVFAALEKSRCVYEVIVVDDCSTDDSVNYLRTNFPQVTIVQNEVNRGFSPTINAGIFAAKHELVFLLNSDVKLEPDYFLPLLPYFDQHDTFGVMGQIVNWEDNQIQDGAKLPTFQGAKIKTFKNFLPSETPINQALYTMYLSGAEALVSREKLLKLGGFDELFAPYYIEDYELSLRAWRLGWKCYYEHRAVCRHKTSSSIRSKSRKRQVQSIYYRNKMFLHAIHLSRWQLIFYYPQLALELLIRALSFRFHYIQSFIFFLQKRHACLQSKQRFQKLSQQEGVHLSLSQVAATILRSLNRTIIWRF